MVAPVNHTATLARRADHAKRADNHHTTSGTRVQPAAPSSDAPSRSWQWFALIAISLAALLTAARIWRPATGHAALPAESATEAALRSVTVGTPEPVAGATVDLPASVRPWQTAELHARVSGYVTAWHKDLGATVKAGELLAVLEAPELDQELAEGESLAREATASAVQAKAELAESEADLKVAEAQLVRAQAEVNLAQSQLARRQKLVASRAVTEEELETFVREVQARTADVAAAQADLTRRQTTLETRRAVIEAREEFARSRQANVDRLQELQAFKRITAPFDGVITRRAAEVGMLVNVGQDALYVVEDNSRVRVQVQVPQTYAMQTTPGVVAAVRLPESSQAEVRATVTRIADSVDAASRTMLAEIELDNAAHRLQPGSYVQVAFELHDDNPNWTIPTNVLSMRVDGPHVAVLDEGNAIELRPVSLGRDLGSQIVVLDGIQGNERLVVNPSDDLRTGMKVRVEVGQQPEPAIARR